MNPYRLHLVPDDNGTILVTSPDLPLVTYGDDEASALRHAADAAESFLASMIDAKEPVPLAPAPPRDPSIRLRLPLQTILKIELYRALREAGLTRAGLQRRLGWQRESTGRLFKLGHNSRLDQLEAALAALGKRYDVDARPAA